jgi:hypothetical protein
MKREQSPRGPDQHPCLAYVGAIAGYTRSSAITPQIAKYPARSLWAGLPYSLLGVLAFRYSHWPDSSASPHLRRPNRRGPSSGGPSHPCAVRHQRSPQPNLHHPRFPTGPPSAILTPFNSPGLAWGRSCRIRPLPGVSTLRKPLLSPGGVASPVSLPPPVQNRASPPNTPSSVPTRLALSCRCRLLESFFRHCASRLRSTQAPLPCPFVPRYPSTAPVPDLRLTFLFLLDYLISFFQRRPDLNTLPVHPSRANTLRYTAYRCRRLLSPRPRPTTDLRGPSFFSSAPSTTACDLICSRFPLGSPSAGWLLQLVLFVTDPFDSDAPTMIELQLSSTAITSTLSFLATLFW